jgi:hypothetical protein
MENTIAWILSGKGYNSNSMRLQVLSVCVKKYQHTHGPKRPRQGSNAWGAGIPIPREATHRGQWLW